MTHEYTSERVAAIAARVLRDPLATEDAKALAGSALTQARDVAQDAAEPDAEFELVQDGVPVASASGKRESAWPEICHYAAVYGQDGPVEIYEVIRRRVEVAK